MRQIPEERAIARGSTGTQEFACAFYASIATNQEPWLATPPIPSTDTPQSKKQCNECQPYGALVFDGCCVVADAARAMWRRLSCCARGRTEPSNLQPKESIKLATRDSRAGRPAGGFSRGPPRHSWRPQRDGGASLVDWEIN